MADLHRHAVDLQLDRRTRCTASATGATLGCRISHHTRFDYGGHKRDHFRLCQWKDHPLGLELLPEVPPPRVNLRGSQPIPARHGTDAFAARIALRDNRRLHFGRPIPPLAPTREYLKPLRAPAHRIITRDYHSSSALPPDQGAETPRCASNLQGGARAPLTILLSDLSGFDADPNAATDDGKAGYAAFGYVVEGMDVVRKIYDVPLSQTMGLGVMKGQMIEKPVRVLTVRRVPIPAAATKATPAP